MGERITLETNGSSRDGHEGRYYLAAGYLSPGDVVIDAACGIGYGSKILEDRKDIFYFGVDRQLDYIEFAESDTRKFLEADLTEWNPHFEFDVFIGFETVEHLANYNNYIQIAKQAKKWALISVPVIPTKHMNPWHLHDFKPGELPNYFVDGNWRLFQALGQPSEFSEIYIFKRQ